ncbi:hypothetical protein B0H34DRAFT_684079 [Crassisporium funariophilum]|nr:hypothetical protein B0H34DRAFT_684079 [Crassisporium funariophilum]
MLSSWLPACLLLVLLPSLAYGQNSSISQTQSQNQSQNQTQTRSSPALTVVTSSSVSTIVSLGPGRVPTTILTTNVFTTTQPVPPSATNATSTSSSTTVTRSNLPTAPANVDGGGQNGAPAPGAKGANGAFGPDDGYIAAAAALAQNAMLAGVVGSLVAGALVVF